ncbi:MAG: glycosyltransferase family 2 protein [Paludibacter sp.]|nr:glycosyltransferase family 2 protein [Paludibacter sp.]
MANPLISVLVAAYNVEKYIERCLVSLINQTYRNLEIIVVDDGSKDKTGIICDQFAKTDSRIKVIYTLNGGLSVARNNGLDNASGEYVVFIDGDDDVSTDMVQKMYHCAEKFTADLVIIGRYNIYQTKTKQEIIHYPKRGILEKQRVMQDLMDDNLGSQTWEKFYSRKLWEDIRFIPGRVYAEDIAIVHYVFHKAKAIASLPEPLYNYYINDDTLTTSYRPFKWLSAYLAFKERLEFAEAYYPAMTTKLRSMTINFARLTLDNYLQRHEECDKESIPEIIERLHSNKKFILKTPYLKWYNKILIFYYNLFPAVYARSIKYIHKVYYYFKPNNFR